ncbi:hypothetical protein [Saccharopolyspora shandongensis]|uniref:hypothetical protein n=1 Tax=Saccharopolyspora shandongensis TaxID=418495 RepID=UPI00340CA528
MQPYATDVRFAAALIRAQRSLDALAPKLHRGEASTEERATLADELAQLANLLRALDAPKVAGAR